MDDFKNDLNEIKKRDFWVASVDDITLYTYERNASTVKISTQIGENETLEKIFIKVNDNLDNDIFSFPLTILIKMPSNLINHKCRLEKGNEALEISSINSNQFTVNIIPNEEEYTIIIEN